MPGAGGGTTARAGSILQRALTTHAFPGCRDMAFPLFDLPAEAVERVLALVAELEDRRALRLVCKRTRAAVDGAVVGVVRVFPAGVQHLGAPHMLALAKAPWHLVSLCFGQVSHRSRAPPPRLSTSPAALETIGDAGNCPLPDW